MTATEDLTLVALLQLHSTTSKGIDFQQHRLVFRSDETQWLREAHFAGPLHNPLGTTDSIVDSLTVETKEPR